MRLYEVQWVDADDNTRREWCGTLADQKAIVKRVKQEGGVPKAVMREVPTNKDGLLEWLNANCSKVIE